MEAWIRFLKEQEEFCSPGDELSEMVSSILGAASRDLDESDLRLVQAARSDPAARGAKHGTQGFRSNKKEDEP